MIKNQNKTILTWFNSEYKEKDFLYIVGVSGGPDSMFLLDNLRKEKYRVVVAHINYRKREDSYKDEEIVVDYCKKYSLSFVIKRIENETYYKKGNFQEKARNIRYDFFKQLAIKNQTNYIIIAHQLNDHHETYLLQKKRNSLVNYWGLAYKGNYKKSLVLRPILSVRKKQIIKYLEKEKIAYIVDVTNFFSVYQRNIVRQNLAKISIQKQKKLTKEIEKKNQELKKNKLLVKKEYKRLINSNILSLEKKIFNWEIYLRLIYYWVNKNTNGLLQKRKKRLLTEIYKQLFISKKNSLIIKLGNNLEILKSNNQAKIMKINFT